MTSFTHTTLGRTGLDVCRLGLSATYRPGKAAIHAALDAGINYFFLFGIDTHMVKALRDLAPSDRQRIVIATGAYNLIWGHTSPRRTLEKHLRRLRTDYLDVFQFLGVLRGKQFPPSLQGEFVRLREEGKVRAIGLSTHDRQFAGKLAEEGNMDVLMIRYNAAHPGAETDIFPHLAAHDPGVVNFTATRWRYLIRRLRGWPQDRPVPTPQQCYRFVLSNPHVHVCLNAPMNRKQMKQNLTALEQGPLANDEMALMREYGAFVHRNSNRWVNKF